MSTEMMDRLKRLMDTGELLKPKDNADMDSGIGAGGDASADAVETANMMTVNPSGTIHRDALGDEGGRHQSEAETISSSSDDSVRILGETESESGSDPSSYATRPPKKKARSAFVTTPFNSHSVAVGRNADEKITPLHSGEQEEQRGQMALPNQSFCPLKTVKLFPYKYFSGDTQEKVSKAFFTEGKFLQRKWDIYYIYPEDDGFANTPILWLSSSQVQAFIDEINELLNLHITFPKDAKDIGFVATFTDDGMPRPRYFGQSRNQEQYQKMANSIPGPSFKPTGEPSQTSPPTEQAREAFRTKMELALASSSNKKKAAKIKKQQERVHKRQEWRKEIKRAQSYLGLQPPYKQGVEIEEDKLTTGSGESTNNVDQPAPFAPQLSIVFICVDCEAWEKQHGYITEIGISTLDTLDLIGVAPGAGGKHWRDKIKTRHFRINEHKHLKNGQHVEHCPDKFEFGTSEFISKADAPKIIADCFKPPMHVSQGVGTTDVAGDAQSNSPGHQGQPGERNVVLIGHNVAQDIGFLRQIGYNVDNNRHLVATLDTATMYQVLTHDINSRTLGTVMYDLDLVGWNLHNAGNDACYTMQVFLAITMKDFQDRGQAALLEESKSLKLALAVEAAKAEAVERVKDDNEGWSSGDGAAGRMEKKKLTDKRHQDKLADDENSTGSEDEVMLPAAEE